MCDDEHQVAAGKQMLEEGEYQGYMRGINATLFGMGNFESPKLGEITKLVVIQSFQIFLIEQDFDAFLDVAHFGNEASFDLGDGITDELIVLQLLSGLHDTDDRRLNHN